ncbi:MULTISPECIES: DNA replication terminus site-binding protein [Halomonas]|uniref:DNA replication terminus site-binding protein n=1 Tax=Halomonas TaxID=2745 RepID=UPI001C93BC1E|nr:MULTISPECIES: DNA replication terminus site-binding protein [Halomonas]MBY6208276.1 DNA replication terminus site-binding protein [Halomonas sp. DP3Y7-2]MBY6229085.1 DNA replication terminus site-binding protein [Halomonas sp. DP3Y7-1]MCA0916932.1 DNA replication terminus site-binding protein [Halomonas denitrificans]
MPRDGHDTSASAPSYQWLAALDQAFDRLVDRAHQVADAWAASGLGGWAFGRDKVDPEWLRQSLLDLWYVDGQDGRVTHSHVGLVCCDDATYAAAQQLNEAKSDLSHQLAEIRQHSPQLMAEIKARLPQRHPDLNQHLGGAGLARLHLKQAWRHVPVAEASVDRVRLAWYSSGRSIKRISVADAEQKLLALDSEAAHIRIQLKRLAGIPSSEMLAQVQRQAPLMRANLFYHEPLTDGRMRRAMNVALPLFLPQQHLPRHNLPPLAPPLERQRARRSDERLEDTPFLPSLRAYRYR